MSWAVVEMVADSAYVTECATFDEAVTHAVGLAGENTDWSAATLRRALRRSRKATEGDWGVYLAPLVKPVKRQR